MTQPPYGPPPEYGQPQYGQPPYGPPPGYGYPGYAPPATEGNAIAALILSIASFLVCPIITAIIALVLAGSAKRNILASGGAKQGLGMVTAARIIAWANIVVVTLFIIVVVLGLAAVRHSGGYTGD